MLDLISRSGEVARQTLLTAASVKRGKTTAFVVVGSKEGWRDEVMGFAFLGEGEETREQRFSKAGFVAFEQVGGRVQLSLEEADC